MLNIETIIDIAKLAGEAILDEYQKPAVADLKSDESPLTNSDRASHNIIQDGLMKAYPDIPLLSEEGLMISFDERKEWSRFWCVDPMDGTKEFIKKSGEFTVNIALIDGQEPVMGVIYAPVLNLFYFAEKGKGSYKWDQNHDNKPQKIDTKGLDQTNIHIVASRDHSGEQVQKLIDQFPDSKTASMGSSLKFCLVAEGKADIYLRDVPTFEWDTAAAQIIVEEAGGSVKTLDRKKLVYNKTNLRNPSIVSIADQEEFWFNHIHSNQ